eukprot:854758_1
MHPILLLLTLTHVSAFSIEAGGHTCALDFVGDDLKCFGSKEYGQLGYGDTIYRMGDNLLSIDLGSAFVPSQVAIGSMHTCALSTTNKVKCFGYNSFGQLV